MFVTSGVISAKWKYVESVENQRCFVPQPTLRLMILLMSLYQMKSFNQLIKINEFFLAFRAVVLDICLPFMPIMTFCDTKKEIQIFC